MSGVRTFLAATCTLGTVYLASPADAGLPRGAVLSADEQSANEQTGETIARGNAEIAIASRRIAGKADVIELRPRLNEVLFKGRAVLSVGARRFESDTVACTLDFMRCAEVESNQDLPALPVGTAETNPR